MEGLRSDYLDNLTTLALRNKKCWKGVYSCDNFKKCALQNNQAYICNLSTSTAISGGTHYVAVILKNNNIYYFDSYGNKCYDRNVLMSHDINNNPTWVTSDWNKIQLIIEPCHFE